MAADGNCGGCREDDDDAGGNGGSNKYDGNSNGDDDSDGLRRAIMPMAITADGEKMTTTPMES